MKKRKRRLGVQKIGNELCLSREEWRQEIHNADTHCGLIYSSKAQRTLCMKGATVMAQAMNSAFTDRGLSGQRKR